MNTICKNIIFCLGVDVLGFPIYHNHKLIFKKYATVLHERYHKSIKHN